MTLHIREMLRRQGRHISFHTPGHKRRGGDITELSYSDDLADPTGVIALAQVDVARILGADASFFLTDGSTCGVLTMLHALARTGARRLALPVSVHKSVRHGCELFGLTPVWLPRRERAGIPCQPTAEELAAALSQADALLLTSPDYYGFLPPLAAAKELCRAQGKPLLIDGAHGSHLHGTPLYAGNVADVWVDGVHKSLPAMTQGAVLSARGAWAQRIAQSVGYFRTTSPSYPILASIEYAVKYPRNARIEGAARAAAERLGAVPNDDWTKLLLPFASTDGVQAYLEAHGVYPEFNDGNYLMFYLSPCTRVGELKKLVRLLAPLERGTPQSEAPIAGMVGGKTVLLPPEGAVGRTCARPCGMVPPCVPLLAEGEVVTADKAARLARARHTFGLTDGNITVYGE